MEIIDQIRQVSSIVEIASQYTNLKRRGRKHVGLCPFHTEKTPSFTVDEEKQLFHCFGCGVGGDVFSLIMEKENLSFPEALRSLAEKYHIPLPQPNVNPQVLKLEEKLFKINDMALGFFRKNLFNTQEGLGAMEYLRKRKLSEQTVQNLKIGYALNSWDSLLSFFQSNNISAPLVEKAGLVLPGKKIGDYYDRFRGRIIFPIFSLTGKIVAFGGRTVLNAEPKYLNSPDTPLYSKGKHLYGLNITKEAIRDAGEAILVEGYTDFAALYQAGVTNVVASLGTALTQDQIFLALRFGSKLVFSYDGDSAGKIATSRAISICFSKAIEPRILILPENLDPDGFIKKYGAASYQDLLNKKSIPLIKFLIDTHSPKDGIKTLDQKIKIASEIMKITLINPNSIAGSQYLKELCHDLALDEDIVRKNLNIKIMDNKNEEKDLLSPAEKRLLEILIGSRDIAPSVFAEIKDGDFLGLKSEPVFRAILDRFQNDKDWSFPDLKEKMGPALAGSLSRILFESNRNASIEEALDCLYSLRKIALQNRLKQLQAEITRSEKHGEKEKVLALLYEKQDVTKQILAL